MAQRLKIPPVHNADRTVREALDQIEIFLNTVIAPLEAKTARLYTGTGTPEGNVTAGVGSVFQRQDGGAGTSLYVKQSGSGNTGWVGK